MKALSNLEVLAGGIAVAAMAVAMWVLGIPGTLAQLAVECLCALGVAVVCATALPWLIPGARRAGSWWRAPLSDAAGKRVMGTVLRAPFYLVALAFALIVAFGYLRAPA